MEFRDLPIEGFRFLNDSIDSVEICFSGIWLKKKMKAVTNDGNTLFVLVPINPKEPGAEKYFKEIVALPIDTIKALYSMQNSMKDNYAELVNEGVKLASSGEIQKAINNFKKAINIDSSREEAYANLANAYDDLGNFEEAISTFEKCIEINPLSPNHYFNLGVIYTNYRNKSFKNIFDFNQPLGQVSDNEENANACFLMATYLGDEEAKRLMGTREIVYSSKEGIKRKKANLQSKEDIIKDLLLIAQYKLSWEFYKSAKKIFKFVLSLDKSNQDAINGIIGCDIEIDNLF